MPKQTTINSGVGTAAAKMTGADRAMDAAAEHVISTAKNIARANRRTGHYLESFGYGPLKGKKGVLDREVFNEDPAANAIESGHVINSAAGPRFVAGQFILTRAARQA